MASETIVRQVDVDDVETEKSQDNGQSTLDAGRGEEIDVTEPKSLIMEIYPWIQQFKKMCRTSLFQPSMASLKHLMMYYTRNVRLSVNECYTKPLRAEKVKDSIGETLLFFLYYYRVIGEDHDRASYMDMLTDLLAMYIDMELKASKKGKEDCGKIAARLTSSLHVYLEHSAEHLLDALLKVHFMTHNYHEILDPVITKIIKDVKEHPSSSIMYVRYFLVYRLWKKLNKNVAVRNQINAYALASLGTAPNDFPSFFIESVQPKVPNFQKLTTKFLLSNKFDVDKCREEFFKFSKRDKGTNPPKSDLKICPAITQQSPVPEDNNERASIVNNNVVNISNDNQENSSSSNLTIQNNDAKTKEVSFLKPIFKPKLLSSRKTKKSNNIVMIDLTSDNVTEKVIRPMKNRRKPNWLATTKKHFNGKPLTFEKMDSTPEDPTNDVQQLEDNPNVDSLRIENLRCEDNPGMETIFAQVTSVEDQTSSEEFPSRMVTEIEDVSTTTEQTNLSISNTIPTIDSGLNCNSNDDDKATMKSENMIKPIETKLTYEEVAEVTSVILKNPAIDSETTSNIEPPPNDEFTIVKSIVDSTMESPNRNTSRVRDDDSETLSPLKLENDEPHVTQVESIRLTIKAERTSDENCEITNEEETISPEDSSLVIDENRPATFEIRENERIERAIDRSNEISENEFQENIDGLSLLASVSQRVSLMTTLPGSTTNQTVNGESIKVKDYRLLANFSGIDETAISDALPTNLTIENQTEIINRVVGIYPENVMDKVAYEVEVTSAVEIDSHANERDDSSNAVVVAFPTNREESCRVNQSQNTNVVANVETPTIVEKDGKSCILSGETVMLLQKSPNSNLYIINKAVENLDRANDEIKTASRDIKERFNEKNGFSYEFPYDNVYRDQSSIPYDLTKYNRDESTQNVGRRKKVIVDVDKTSKTKKILNNVESSKSGKNLVLPLDVIAKVSPVKRKNSSNSGLNRRRRIKQEYNECVNDLTARITPNYGIKECSQERVETNLSSIHNSSSRSASLSSIYTTYTGSAELYLPCHKNFNSITCGLPITSKASTVNETHCTCLNCTYGIVAHCGECILPNTENHSNSMENNSYYLPIHSSVKPSIVQDRANQDELGEIYDDKLVCKFEQTIVNGKPLENVEIKCKSKEIYRAEIDNKLPLKKRFRAMMSVSFEETSIKREKTQSYPGTPMISIAALDSREGFVDDTTVVNDSLDLSLQERDETHGSSHHSSEMIRRDYRKDAMSMTPPTLASNGHRDNSNSVENASCNNVNNGGERKRKKKINSNDSLACEVDETRREVENKKMYKTTVTMAKRSTVTNKSQARPSEKLKESDAVPTKNSTRQTRSSKRNLPKVNYIYTDGDSDWNPSAGGLKRKRKKINR